MTIANLGRVIAAGRTAEMYAIDDGRVLKLFRPGRARADADYEWGIAQTINRSGLPAPKAHDLIEVEGRSGIVYDRVHGESMLRRLRSRPWQALALARVLAEAHGSIHAHTGHGLPSQRERMRRQINQLAMLSESERGRVAARITAQPDDDAVCHGDLHPDNVLLTADGPRVIDWHNATVGNPAADVQWTSLVLQVGAMPDGMPAMQRLFVTGLRRAFHQTYLKHYIARSRRRKRDIDAWHVPCAAARLSDGITHEREGLLRVIRGVDGGVDS